MIKMVEIIKKYWLIIIIFVAAVIGITVLIISGQGENNQNQKLQPTPITESRVAATPTAPPAAKSGFGPNPIGSTQIELQIQELEQNKKDYPLATVLPYKTDLFTIDHYRGPRLLVVIVKKESDEKAAGLQIGEWLVKNGFDANSHQIIWTISN
jgi:hypothetical protein